MTTCDAIREIRINQNPFASESDKLGLGRIEIFTKPGTGKFAGSVYYNFAHQFWNSRNPYAQQKAPFLLYEYGGSVSGPLNKRASFFLDVRRDHINEERRLNPVSEGIPFQQYGRSDQGSGPGYCPQQLPSMTAWKK